MANSLTTTLPTFIPLSEAAKKYNLAENVLTRLVQNGRIEAAQLSSGGIFVSDDDLDQTQIRERIIEEKFGHLRGHPITISDAANSYRVPNTTLREWIAREHIELAGDGYPTKIDEATVAYCAEVYHERGGGPGTRIFDEDGNPYKLKHPNLSKYRQRKKQLAG